MVITASDFDDWKKQDVTKAYFFACQERIDEAVDVLSNTAGTDAVQDNFYRGFIYAYRELMSFRLDDVENADGN